MNPGGITIVYDKSKISKDQLQLVYLINWAEYNADEYEALLEVFKSKLKGVREEIGLDGSVTVKEQSVQ